MRDFQSLLAWQRAHALTLEIYEASAAFPQNERYAFTQQVRRAASSIGANLAEGCGHDSPAEFARFVGISLGLASELENHLLLAGDLGYVPNEKRQILSKKTQEVKQMLTGLKRKLRPR